jgi:hypothetical protein
MPDASPRASHGTTQVEMDTISVPLRVTAIDTGLSGNALRRRSNANGDHDPFVLESASRPSALPYSFANTVALA